MANRVCPNCGIELEEDVVFCPNCGTNTNDANNVASGGPEDRGEPVNCPGCNNAVMTNDEFCSFCGYKVREHMLNLIEKEDEATLSVFTPNKVDTKGNIEAPVESVPVNKPEVVQPVMPPVMPTVPNDNKANKKSKKPIVIIIIVLLLLIGGAAAYFYFASPKTVTWLCSHNKKVDATCTDDAYCERCGKTFEEATGHNYERATCTKPQICSECGDRNGSPNGHDWEAATCLAPKTCKTCGVTEGDVAAHDWKDATCYSPKTCRLCGAEDGYPLEHEYKDFICKNCGEAYTDYTKNDVRQKILTLSFRFEKDGDNVIQYLKFYNAGSKTISRIDCYVKLYDDTRPIGDPYYDGDLYASPMSLNSRENTELAWTLDMPGYGDDGNPCIYFEKIIITYTDGKKITLNAEQSKYTYTN